MSIPNTTPTPNELFNGEMKKMSDAELRVTMIVTRATFGWVLDEETGMRKEEDWISLSQMVAKSGKSARAIKYAVQGCIENGWIEVRGQDGELLDTGDKRQQYGKKLFYRLGPKLLGRVKEKTSANNAQVGPVQNTTGTSAKYDSKPVQPLHPTKESITKETPTKEPPSFSTHLSTSENSTVPVSQEPPLAPPFSANRLADAQWLKNLSGVDLIYFTEKYPQLTEQEIRNQADNAYLWLEENPGKGRSGKKLFFKNWLDRYVGGFGKKKGVTSFHEYR